MKASDLREKSVEDLKELGKSLASDVFQNRLKNFTNRLDDTSSIRKTKRELARVTTLLREVELGIKRGAGAAKDKSESKAASAPAEARGTEKAKASTAKKAPKVSEGKAEGASRAKTAKKSEAKKS
jgi:large subunit ribosomal protein L29